MRKAALYFTLLSLLFSGYAMAATEEAKQLAIDSGLAWLASTQVMSGAEGYWPYAEYGTLATTASAALAFIEEGYVPGDGSMYDDVITRAVTYIFNRATVDSRFGVETAVYTRYAEDYNNDGIFDEGNDEAIFFNPGSSSRRLYTTGIVTPVVYALGEELGINTVVGIGSAAISGKTYAEAMQDLVDWFSWGQVEPNRGDYRGGWRYDANYPQSDNSTAQWGSLPMLYAADWGLGVPQYVFFELELWANYIQNANGGSGYTTPNNYVNMSKTGGLLLELKTIGADISDPRVAAAVGFISSRWNTSVNNTWYGNFNNAYAMWAVYKGLQVYGLLTYFNCGTQDILVGEGIPAAPGGFTICSVAAPATSVAGDWYSHYCDYLVNIQNGNGSWSGSSSWTGALATGWYINILNAVQIDVEECDQPMLRLATYRTVSYAPPLWTVQVQVLNDGPGEAVNIAVTMNEGIPWLSIPDPNCYYGDILEGGASWGDPDDYTFDLTNSPGGSFNAWFLVTYEDTCGNEYELILDPEFEPENPSVTSATYMLAQNQPNPFNPTTSITFQIPNEDRVTLIIYDASGRIVRTLINEHRPAGSHTIQWDGKDNIGMPVVSGVYFYQMKSGMKVLNKKMILLR